ncbi:hypothetical protein MMC28_011047 [Mycoblastus sanguinarius]|nr:hypothetical protein [Mycoblastus sanguinarius]
MQGPRSLFALLPKTLIILLTLLEISATAPTRPKLDLDYRRLSPQQNQSSSEASYLHRYAPKARTPPSKLASDTLHGRMMPGLTPIITKIRMRSFQKIASILPIATAARNLEEFYSAISTKARNEWAQMPQKDSFDIIEGNFHLSFFCLGDTIPWSFVSDIADRLWETAALGMANLFEVIYMDDAAQVGVHVVLRLVEGSSSSSEGYREGSVPSVTGPVN